MSIHRLPIAVLAMSLLAGGCAYHSAATTPIQRSLTWFSYLDGDDLRAACGPKSPDRFRLVYNAVYVQQVRTYDITADAHGGGAKLDARVFGAADLKPFPILQPTDLLTPWKGETANRRLDAAELGQLRDSLRASGVYKPLAGRLNLDSDGFYWVVTACTGGHFAFNAYRWPSKRFAAAAFPALLFGWDSTGVAVNPPHQVDPRMVHHASPGEEMRGAQRFKLAAESGGLVGNLKLF